MKPIRRSIGRLLDWLVAIPAIGDLLAFVSSMILPRLLLFREDYFLVDKRKLRYFQFFERNGIHIRPVHFYEPMPDTRRLKPALWSQPFDLTGIRMGEERQVQLLETFVSEYRPEFEIIPLHKTEQPFQYYLDNGAYGRVDAEITYCMVRYFKPRRVIEIGSGHSTRLLAQALRANALEVGSQEYELISIDPYPEEGLKQGFPGLTQQIQSEVQDVAPERIANSLNDCDILFIDSSHVLRTGSDVQYEILQILPLLKPGVLVHFHDIFLPLEYPQDWVMKRQIFWNEQYVLHAFLMFNSDFEVRWASQYMALAQQEKLGAAFRGFDPRLHRPSSFWIQRAR